MDSQPSPSTPRRLSSYTLKTIDDERTGLLKGKGVDVEAAPHYGTVPVHEAPELTPAQARRKLLVAGLQMAVLFVVSTIALYLVLKLALPTLDEEDRPYLRVPRTFEQLQQLNTLLKKYRDLYPFRIVVCFVITYLFLQAFSLPGSMYMSILAGAVWGPARAIPLCCTCVASGATLCYFIGAAMGPVLLILPSWKARLDAWAIKVNAERANLIPFLIVLRIAPFPPHWVVNVLCPHVGIGLVPFFISTWLGIMGVTVIHTTIGGGLDQMTSPEDFHLISWRNFLGLSAVVVAVLIPVGIRYYFRGQIESVAAVEAEAQVDDGDEIQETDINKGKSLPPGPIFFESDDEEAYRAESLDAKGKGVDRRDWLMDDSDGDEPLGPPPPISPRSSTESVHVDQKYVVPPPPPQEDIKHLG